MAWQIRVRELSPELSPQSTGNQRGRSAFCAPPQVPAPLRKSLTFQSGHEGKYGLDLKETSVCSNSSSGQQSFKSSPSTPGSSSPLSWISSYHVFEKLKTWSEDVTHTMEMPLIYYDLIVWQNLHSKMGSSKPCLLLTVLWKTWTWTSGLNPFIIHQVSPCPCHVETDGERNQESEYRHQQTKGPFRGSRACSTCP